MSKDPAFLMYSKDWLEGTAEMLPEEKGVYIDLLCYQHQRGDLPNDIKRLARLVRLSEDEFNKIWEIISTKFERMDNRLVNRKLNEVMTERLNKGKRNAIIGKFASLLKNANLNKKEYNLIKSEFNLVKFERMDNQKASERLTEWFNLCLKRIKDENANANEDKDENINDIVLPFDSEKFKEYWLLWKLYKKKEHKFYYKSKISEQAALKKLGQLSGNNEQKAIIIIENSMANGYKGLFEIKNYENTRSISNIYKQQILDSIND